MGALLTTVGGWLLANSLARILTGATLTLVTATWVGGYVNSLLSSLANQWSGVSADTLAFLAYSGVGNYLSIVGSAIVARVAITAAAGVLGIGKAV